MRNSGLIVVIVALLFACSSEKKATKAFRLGKYQTTINIVKEQLEKDPDNGPANYIVAESYRLSNRLKEAEPYYARAGGRDIDPDTVKFYYAQSLEMNGKYDAARKVWQEVAKTGESERLRERAEGKIAA